MHPLDAPGALWVLSRAGKVPRPPAGGRNLSRKTDFLWLARERPPLSFCSAEGFASAEATKGLSDRPLETFGPLLRMVLPQETDFLWLARKRLPTFFYFYRGFRLCGGDQRAFRSPFGNLRSFAANGSSIRNTFRANARKKSPPFPPFIKQGRSPHQPVRGAPLFFVFPQAVNSQSLFRAIISSLSNDRMLVTAAAT